MRLTLRTLLAYRDGVLDPQDAAALEAKLRDSSTAQHISQRIEEGMRNRKLAPIPVDAREFGFEPNLVAEYLDDTIPVEYLPEMERKCLENNALLSEIGSCHQILSRALSVPASVPGSLRQRIRELPANPTSPLAKSLDKRGQIRRVDRGSVATSEAPAIGQTNGPTTATGSLRKRNVELRASGIELSDVLGKQVPEYLMGNDRGWVRGAIIASSLLIGFIVVGFYAVGPLERVTALLNKNNGAPIDSASQPEKAAGRTDRKSTDQDIDSLEGTFAAPPVPPKPSEKDSSEDRKPVIEETSKPELPPPASSGSKDEDLTKPIVKANGRIQWLPEDKPSSESIVLKGIRPNSDQPIKWVRLGAGEWVNNGDRILVPPAQRTELRVEPGIRWLCAGENDLDVLPGDSISLVGMRAGRAILFATPDARAIDLQCQGVLLSIRFTSVDASCAIEVLNELKATSDEQLKTNSLNTSSTVRLLGVQGTIEFTAKDSKDQAASDKLGVGQFLVWRNGAVSAKQELNEAPWWLRTSFERPIDQLAATEVQQSLSKVDAADWDAEWLKLAGHRRGETAALATRTRIMQGHYDGLFSSQGALNRKELHVHWNAILAQISQSFGRQENVSAFFETLNQEVPSRAQSLLALFVPKSQDELIAGADKLIIESLSSSSLDERVLAIYQLASITGKSLGFHPDKNSVEAIQLWRKMLGKGEIRYPESQIH
jgi:hypothetical protein